ncbi:uncharacterized [Tachysurus ichikawai]
MAPGRLGFVPHFPPYRPCTFTPSAEVTNFSTTAMLGGAPYGQDQSAALCRVGVHKPMPGVCVILMERLRERSSVFTYHCNKPSAEQTLLKTTLAINVQIYEPAELVIH